MKSKAGKTILVLIASAVSIGAAFYACSALNAVAGRSQATVAKTVWLSFESGKLDFGEGEGSWAKTFGIYGFSWKEDAGIVSAKYDSGGRFYFIREGEKELISPDGKEIFYLYEAKESSNS